jgi:ABC-type dipeptide/oligopeptide/nickel transport system permease component
MFALQPVTPVIVRIVSAPTPQVSVVDVMVDALGLTGLIVIVSLVVGGVLGVLLIVYKRWRSERTGQTTSTDHTPLDLSSPLR